MIIHSRSTVIIRSYGNASKYIVEAGLVLVVAVLIVILMNLVNRLPDNFLELCLVYVNFVSCARHHLRLLRSRENNFC